MKNPGYRDFLRKKNKNPGTRDFLPTTKKKSWVPGFTGKIFRRYAPDQNIDLRPNGGGADGVLGREGKFAVGQT